jgi:hypothetical protein
MKELMAHALCYFRWGSFGLGNHSKCPRCTRLWDETLVRLHSLVPPPPPRDRLMLLPEGIKFQRIFIKPLDPRLLPYIPDPEPEL